MKKLFTPIITRWKEPDGYKHILLLALPLIISQGSYSLQSFIDRMFLSWYSTDAIAAAMPAGILNHTLMSFFIGAAGYITTFVAQYKGAGYPQKIGPSVWQGIYLSFFGALVIFLLIPLAPLLFKLANHDLEIQKLEVTYFSILCYGAFPAICGSALSGFKSGLGQTWPVLVVNLIATGFNLIADYILIFGKLGFPELGIKGAAIATALSQVVALIIYIFIIFNKKNNEKYKVISGFKFDWKIFKRLIRFGLPSGVQFFLDAGAFSVFLLILGSLGREALAATNISFSINTITFMPMTGLGIAISVLVGQNQGKEKPEASVRAVWNGFHIVFAYMSLMALLLFTIPDFFTAPFLRSGDESANEIIRVISRVLLKFIAIYTLFDSFTVLFASALKGAGDTKFVMLANSLFSIFLFVIPSYLVVITFGMGVYSAWAVASIYISILGLNFLARFLSGKWKTMRVIEEHHIDLPTD